MGVDAANLNTSVSIQKPDYQVVAQNFYDPRVFRPRPIQRYDQFQQNPYQELMMEGNLVLDQFRRTYGFPLSDTRDMADHKNNSEAIRFGRTHLEEYASAIGSYNINRVQKFVQRTHFANCDAQAQLVNNFARRAGYNSNIVVVSFTNPQTGELTGAHFAVAIAPKGFNNWGNTDSVAQNAIVVDSWAKPPNDRPASFSRWLWATRNTFGIQNKIEIGFADEKGNSVGF